MKIVHTSDWHAGRFWKGISRNDEHASVLENLAEFIEREKVDVLLVSGDLFDNGSPSAEAERVVFSFFKRVGKSGAQTVVIAGNHDNPHRLNAWGTLAELVDVHVVELPCARDKGGVIPLTTRGGETAMVAAIPFAPPGRIVSALELAGDDTAVKQKYAHFMQRLADNLAGGFGKDTVNLMMAHTHLDGAVFSNTERQVHLGDDWCATPQIFPTSAHYVALGHIHNPQAVSTAKAPAYYAGSLMQLDFGEISEEKSFVVIDAKAGRPARIERVPYRGALPLVEERRTLLEIERDAETLRKAGWLRVVVPLDQPDADVNQRVRKLLPNALVVRTELAHAPLPAEHAPRGGMTPAEQYRAYYQLRHKTVPADALVDAFVDLYRSQEEQSECVPSA
ncbi:MAG: exonuclease SbcCD subunit D [Armatimonadetes bacterium]|nr:exonuclease SbcCD subunit D [Armatimonadota bacterium]